MRLALIGLGLIGGSIARALRARERDQWNIAGWTPTGNGARAARDAGVIDRVAASLSAVVDGADVVLLAAPPLACLALIDELSRTPLAPDAVVTDVASTKRAIVARARDAGLAFVGGHPMAGRETSGFEAADGTLFVDRPWVVCAGEERSAADVARVERVARATGAVPVRMTPEAHDAAVGSVSHLPLVVSAALVEAVLASADADARTAALGLAASGWRDTTRLARGDPAMGAGILATNADVVCARLHAMRDAIDAWLAELERRGGPNPARIEGRLAAIRDLATEPGEKRDDD